MSAKMYSILMLAVFAHARIIPVSEDPEQNNRNILNTTISTVTGISTPPPSTIAAAESQSSSVIRQNQIPSVPPKVYFQPVSVLPTSVPTQTSSKDGQNNAPAGGSSYIFQKLRHSSVPYEHPKEDEQVYPQYHFSYAVEDHHSGDFHSHEETRDGDKVVGKYSLHDADGFIRTVKYTADKENGFNAIVERTLKTLH